MLMYLGTELGTEKEQQQHIVEPASFMFVKKDLINPFQVLYHKFIQ